MKTTTHAIIALTFLTSCGQQARQNEQQTNYSEKNQTELVLPQKNKEQEIEKKFGQELFKLILDTITIKTISTDFLINNQWVYRPFDNCESYLKFQINGKGISYNCEMDEDYEMTQKRAISFILIVCFYYIEQSYTYPLLKILIPHRNRCSKS
jgi:hypothetical protein